MGEFAHKKQEQQQVWADAQLKVVRMGMNQISLQNYAGLGVFTPRGWTGGSGFGMPQEATVNAGPLDSILGVKRENISNEWNGGKFKEYFAIRVRAGIKKETAQALEGMQNVLVTYVSKGGRVSSMDESGIGINEPYLWNEFGSVKGIVKSGGKDCLEVMSVAGGGWDKHAKPMSVLIPLEDITHVQQGYSPGKK